MHNHLAIPMELIPQSVRDNNSAFWGGLFNKDKTKRLLDGYLIDADEEVIEPKKLAHIDEALYYWCRFEETPNQVIADILAGSEVMKPSEIKAAKYNPESEWFEEVLI